MRRGCCFVVGILLAAFFALPVFDQARAGSADSHTASSEGGVLTGTIRLGSGAKKDENTVVYLEGITGAYRAPEQVAVLDQNHELFMPHLLAVQNGQTVRFSNSEPVSHNVHVFRGARTLVNVVHFMGQDHDWIPPRPGEYEVHCNIHRQMSAFILVLEHPFFAAVTQQGFAPAQFKIEGIPEGTYTLVAVRDKKGTLERQEQKVTIKAKQNATVSLTIPD
jgi:plastocyanin